MHKKCLDFTEPCTIVAFRVLLQNNIVWSREKWAHWYPLSPLLMIQLLKSLKDSSNSKEIFILTSFVFIPLSSALSPPSSSRGRMNTSARSNSPVSTMSTKLLTVKQDLWCTISYNSESGKEKMSKVKNIYVAYLLNISSNCDLNVT